MRLRIGGSPLRTVDSCIDRVQLLYSTCSSERVSLFDFWEGKSELKEKDKLFLHFLRSPLHGTQAVKVCHKKEKLDSCSNANQRQKKDEQC